MNEGNTQGIIKTLFFLMVFSLCAFQSFSQKKLSVHLSAHHGYHFITANGEKEEGEKGRFGNGIEVRYYLGSQSRKISTSFGLGYNRIGNSRTFQWTDATPEREEEYGQFPISYEMWDDVHYLSFPFYLSFSPGSDWIFRVSASLDYPLGNGYFRERSSADLQVIDTFQDNFNFGKAYPFNTSIGSSLLIGRAFSLSESIEFVIESQFKIYTLLAARSNDYFPHEEYQRPFTIGVIAGIRF